MSTEDEVLLAVDAIIDDFGNHRRAAYFSRFAADATFVFHTSPARLESRAEYEELWCGWERDDEFHVISCQSTNRRVQLLDDIAVFTHDVDTTVSLGGQVEHSRERETILMERRGDEWLCVHEHLSGRD
ncbi:MAG: DUF4440 domain-containing protein [Microbacteriaceae bacterium]|nr:MAG: DUF4440 domain-containing protein [Microbacteriaceae bacterium]